MPPENASNISVLPVPTFKPSLNRLIPFLDRAFLYHDSSILLPALKLPLLQHNAVYTRLHQRVDACDFSFEQT